MMSDGAPMDMMMSANLPNAVLDPDMALLAEQEDLMTMSLNLQNVVNPDTFQGDTTAVCDVIPDAECDLIDGACVCEFDEDVACDRLFDHEHRLVPVLGEEGMMLFSGSGCSCSGPRTCSLSLLNSVPPVRTSSDASSAIQLSNNAAGVCEPTTTCPNMHQCDFISYGASGCGYSCENDEGRHWCSDRCACNKEEAVVDCAANTVCPDMDSCNPISYGDYGCGFGCMSGSTFHFCNDACTTCNV
jgi:hypothetical protein